MAEVKRINFKTLRGLGKRINPFSGALSAKTDAIVDPYAEILEDEELTAEQKKALIAQMKKIESRGTVTESVKGEEEKKGIPVVERPRVDNRRAAQKGHAPKRVKDDDERAL